MEHSQWRSFPVSRQWKTFSGKPERDYRSFRLSRINFPEYAHLKLLYGWIVYFSLYYLTEKGIPAENCTPMHMWLDDVIPFCEWFVIPYVFWYGMLVFSIGYFALYHVQSFRKLQTYFILTQVLAMMIYVFFPSRQDLRPVTFPRENILTDMVQLLYRIDTNTNVCPSMHVALSVAMASVWCREKIDAARKAFVVFAAVLICLSTMFIKQHSAADVLAALLLCAVAEWIVFGKYNRNRKSSTK